MKTNWTSIKRIIESTNRREDLYLSVIDEDGYISCANANMVRSLDIGDPRSNQTNFFDLIHPSHIEDFKKIVHCTSQQQPGAAMELYIKNGHYHPMKWQVNYLQECNSPKKSFFCLGYKLIDNQRLQKFNDLADKHYQLIRDGLTGVIFHDKAGEIIATNQQTATLFNSSLERLYQIKNIRELWQTAWKISDETGEAVSFDDAPFMVALQTGRTQEKALEIRTGNGEYRWMLFNSQPLPDDHSGTGCHAVTNIIDVTNERILNARVQINKALIDAFIKQTPNLAWVIDEDIRLVFASAAFCQHFGLDERDCLDKPMSQLVPPIVFNALYEKHVEVFETGKGVKTAERVKMADGTNYVSHINLFPVEITKGKKMVGGYAVNLPDTMRIEADLREANQRLLTITKAVSNAIWEWDMQTGKIFRNEVLLKMIGYPLEHAKGLSWWLRRIHPEDRNRVSDKVKEATENNRYSWQDEYRFKCADGTYKHIQDKGFVIYENGLPVKMIGSLQDISDLKELEDQLANEKLQRQREITETVIQVQERERTRMGHELHDNVNQVLSTAMLFVDMLSAESKEQKQIKEKSLGYLSTAIEEIRKLSKELVIPEFKERGLIDSITALVHDIQLAHAIRIKFIHDIDPDLISPGKKIILFRIVQEQMKNILKHSKAKKAEIILRLAERELELIIKDDGIGFDTRQTHRGIGLSNISERVSFYNGQVDVQAAPGKGCMIRVTLGPG